MMRAMEVNRDNDPSPLQDIGVDTEKADIQAAVMDTIDKAKMAMPDLTQEELEAMQMAFEYASDKVFRAKFGLSKPANIPPMKIVLLPGARPSGRRPPKRNLSDGQFEFLEGHLPTLVNLGVISRIEGSAWCCPVVLVLKPDGSWRLCVDPRYLNANVEIEHWDMPDTPKDLQLRLHGSRYFLKLDLLKSFWQLLIDPASRHLFSFYCHPFGCYCFNRVAMGFTNSSCYLQKHVSIILHNAGLLRKGAELQTDDVLLHHVTFLGLMLLFIRLLDVLAQHNIVAHPGKIEIATRMIFCGALLTPQGSTVDPQRVRGVSLMSPPRSLGDLYQFLCATGWLSEYIFNHARLVKELREFVDDTRLRQSGQRNVANSQLRAGNGQPSLVVSERDRQWSCQWHCPFRDVGQVDFARGMDGPLKYLPSPWLLWCSLLIVCRLSIRQ
jgi:hypothetical protein